MEIKDRILYEDNHIIIVNKLVGEIVQGDRSGDRTLGDEVKAFIKERDSKPGEVYLGLPHRLDRPVSGIVIFAKTSKALGRLGEMFRDGAVHKTYWALLTGEPSQPSAEVEDWMYRIEKQNKSYIGKRPDSKLARLRYHYIGRTRNFYLSEVELLTGRHHQIRCQMAHHVAPIKGDLKYGAARSNPDGGICLHSRSVEFIHPVKKIPVRVEAPLPSSWPPVEMF